MAVMVGRGAMTNSIAELENAKLIFATGTNTTETHPVLALRVKRAVSKGAKAHRGGPPPHRAHHPGPPLDAPAHWN